jgi:hypothetical protein
MLRLAILSGLLAIATVTWGQEAVGPVGAAAEEAWGMEQAQWPRRPTSDMAVLFDPHQELLDPYARYR